MPMRISAIVLALALSGVAHAEVVDARALYPEGALWRDGAIHYTEMGADQVARVAHGRKQVVWSERGCGPTSLAPYGGGLLVLCHISAQLVALDAKSAVVRRWLRDDAGLRLQDPNDSSADARGGVYFSDPGLFSVDARTSGAVLYLAPDGRLRRVASNLRYPNGVFVDRTENMLYVDEHLTRRVLRYPILADGGLGEMQVFADLNRIVGRINDYAEAGPDGLERGPDGDLYVCLYGEGRILRLTREGRLAAAIPVPTPFLTNIAFAPDGSAYVTGSYENARPPLRGAVIRLAPEALKPPRR
jgi:gluconolactonase